MYEVLNFVLYRQFDVLFCDAAAYRCRVTLLCDAVLSQARGRLLMFEVDYAYLAREDGKHEHAVKLRQVFAKEQLGPVSGEVGAMLEIEQAGLGGHLCSDCPPRVVGVYVGMPRETPPFVSTLFFLPFPCLVSRNSVIPRIAPFFTSCSEPQLLEQREGASLSSVSDLIPRLSSTFRV